MIQKILLFHKIKLIHIKKLKNIDNSNDNMKKSNIQKYNYQAFHQV